MFLRIQVFFWFGDYFFKQNGCLKDFFFSFFGDDQNYIERWLLEGFYSILVRYLFSCRLRLRDFESVF